jgi:EAL domain-containing protein (putative c-di-GMP-specific phosphodiesterase class I)
MYRAKAAGKACYEVFSLGMREQALRRLELESDLRQALERQELLLYYQPIVTFDTGKITGFEALVRWQHPKQGLVFPGEFINIAEETGLIIPMGQWIFQTACRQLKDWHQQFPKDPSLLMSINLSGAQFTQSDLVEVIAHTLRAANLEGHQIKLELTESMMMANADGVIALLLRLKSLNLKLGIDDFGTGYSSLSYLHRFPMDTLKIDRSFVSQMDEASNDAEIVRTIIMLSHTLGLDVIAEGIETQAQLETLRQLGCEHGQGYFLAKPLSSDAATALLAEDPQW